MSRPVSARACHQGQGRPQAPVLQRASAAVRRHAFERDGTQHSALAASPCVPVRPAGGSSSEAHLGVTGVGGKASRGSCVSSPSAWPGCIPGRPAHPAALVLRGEARALVGPYAGVAQPRLCPLAAHRRPAEQVLAQWLPPRVHRLGQEVGGWLTRHLVMTLTDWCNTKTTQYIPELVSSYKRNLRVPYGSSSSRNRLPCGLETSDAPSPTFSTGRDGCGQLVGCLR